MVRQIHLDQTLKEIVGASKLRAEDSTEREQVIKKLGGVVAGSSYLAGSSVGAYGSFVSQLSTRWGDLDMSIILPNRLSNMSNIQALSILQKDLRSLPAQDGWHIMECFPYAKVPILKLYHHQLGINNRICCDVSVNNWSAQVKSKLLHLISQMDKRFHDMVLLVKEWAQSKDINDPKPGKGTFNSYCLTLLVIFHFQTCDPPILPPLHHIYSKSVDRVLNELGVSKKVAMQNIVEECGKNIDAWRSSNISRQINESSLSDLFISFMEEFSDLSESANVDRICTSMASRYQYSVQTYNRQTQLCVVDPFETTENVARTVVPKSGPKIREAFRSTHDILTKSTHQLSPERLFEELSKHVSTSSSRSISSNFPPPTRESYTAAGPVFVNRSQWVPQQPGIPRYTMIGSTSSTNRTIYPEARLQQQDYGFKG